MIRGGVRTGMGWAGIARLGLVQVAIGASAVLMTSTLNRIMVVELGLPAILPGALVALHFAVQIARPRFGYGSDVAGRRLPWIWRGMALVAASGLLASAATVLMDGSLLLGIFVAMLAFVGLGAGLSAAATPLLAYLTERVAPARMPAAAALLWILMIVGIVLGAGIMGSLLDPYGPSRLLAVTAGLSAATLLLTALALVGRREDGSVEAAAPHPDAPFGQALRELWDDREARRFAIFVFVSMLGYSMQDIILEPFAGEVFGLTPGASTRIAGLQHGGALVGMILAGIVCGRFGVLRIWSAAGCIASGVALCGLIVIPFVGTEAHLRMAVLGLGVANGVFAVAAIGMMMRLTLKGRPGRAGLRMGFWGAAQAAAYGIGGFFGAGARDVLLGVLGDPALGYAGVFTIEAALFMAAGVLLYAPDVALRPVRSVARWARPGRFAPGGGAS